MKTIIGLAFLCSLVTACAMGGEEDEADIDIGLAQEDKCESVETRHFLNAFNACSTPTKVDFECRDRAADDYGRQILKCQNMALLLNGY